MLGLAGGRNGVPQVAGELTHLRLRGPLTASTSSRLRRLLDAEAAITDRSLLLDLEGVTAMDASGIAALLDGQRALAARPAGAMFLRPNRMVTTALKRSGTISAFRIWPTPAPDGVPFIELA
jgi:anti-anti-sigma factor